MNQSAYRVMALSILLSAQKNSSFGQKIFIPWTIYPALECRYGDEV